MLSRQRGTMSWCRLAERRRRREATSEAGVRWSARYRGAWPCKQRCIMTPSLYITLSETSSQCRRVERPRSYFFVSLTTRAAAAALSTRCNISLPNFVMASSSLPTFKRRLMPWLQLRFDYDTTTIRLRRIARAPASIRRDSTRAKMNMSVFRSSRIVVVSQSNRTHIVISITFVVVECIVVSSYRSRIVVESQLWHRL